MSLGKTEFYPVRFPLEKFLEIPEVERVFFVQLGWLCNDIMVLHRLMQASAKGPDSVDDKTQLLQRGYSSQLSFATRLFAGRLHEGWTMCRRAYFGGKISEIYHPLLGSEAAAAIKALKAYFGTANLISDIRNRYAFHSCSEELKRSMSSMRPNMDLSIYFTRYQGNMLYWYADEIVGNGILSLRPGKSLEEVLDSIWSECLKVSSDLLLFSAHSTKIFIDRHLGGDFVPRRDNVLVLGGLQSLDDIHLPFFVSDEDAATRDK